MRWIRSKRRWAIGFLLIAILLLGRALWLTVQGRSGLEEIRRRGVLRVGLDASFPPLEMLDAQGQVIGLDADIARAIAADLGVQVEFVNIGFDGLYDALKAERVDLLLSGLPVDPHLTQDVAYSVNYFNAGQVLVTTDPAVQSLEDLTGQTVAVEWGSMADMAARRLTVDGLEIIPQPDPESALQHPIAIVDGVTALGEPHLIIVAYLTDDWYAGAVSIENQALLREVNRTLSRLTKDAPPPCHLQVPRFGANYGQQLETCYAP